MESIQISCISNLLVLNVIISCKMLIITGKSTEKTNELTIMSKRHNISPTRSSFYISSAGKIDSVQEFKIKLFE